MNDCVYLGTTSRGTPVEIFRPVTEADIVVCTGTIEFHYYAVITGIFSGISVFSFLVFIILFLSFMDFEYNAYKPYRAGKF